MSAKLPILHEGEIMVHTKTRTIGRVVGTIYPPDNQLEKFEQVLVLTDGSRRQFRLVELVAAAEDVAEQFWEDAKTARRAEG